MATCAKCIVPGVAIVVCLIGSPPATAQTGEMLLPEGCIIIEGDIVVPSNFFDAPDRKNVTYSSNLWPDGIIPYEFDSNITSQNQDKMLSAMAEWEAVANLDFRPRINETDYLHIFSGEGNWSYIGQQGGLQYLSITHWDFRFIMAHELCHTLGFWHEQSRPDRDNYVQIVWNNIKPEKEKNFAIHNEAALTGPYDFDSVMHYPQCTFSICAQDCSQYPDNCRTIKVLPPNEAWQERIGQRNHLSAGDIEEMQYLYGSRQSGNDIFESNDSFDETPRPCPCGACSLPMMATTILGLYGLSLPRKRRQKIVNAT